MPPDAVRVELTVAPPVKVTAFTVTVLPATVMVYSSGMVNCAAGDREDAVDVAAGASLCQRRRH